MAPPSQRSREQQLWPLPTPCLREQHGGTHAHLLQQRKVQPLHQVSVLHVTTQELGLLDQLPPLLGCGFIPVPQTRRQLRHGPPRAAGPGEAAPRAHVRLCRWPHGPVIGRRADQLRLLVVLVHPVPPLLGSVPVLLGQLPLALDLLLPQLRVVAGVGERRRSGTRRHR